ncbi:MAG: thioredoxin [Thermoplasmata archaeon]|nr:thioredoxin [Thermoplasmata archaeon]
MDEELLAIRQKKMREIMSAAEQNKEKGAWPVSPVEVTDSNFDSMTKQYGAIVVDCWAPWCGPCRMIAPTIEALAKDYKGKAVFGKLNTDENVAIATKFGIMSIPTLLFFKNGKLVDKMIGAVPRQYIEERLKKIL